MLRGAVGGLLAVAGVGLSFGHALCGELGAHLVGAVRAALAARVPEPSP